MYSGEQYLLRLLQDQVFSNSGFGHNVLKNSGSHLHSDLSTGICPLTEFVLMLLCSQSPRKAAVTVAVAEKSRAREVAQPAQRPQQMGISLRMQPGLLHFWLVLAFTTAAVTGTGGEC